jgi:Uma2 family endonuclease
MQKFTQVSQYELERGKPMPSKFHGFIQTKIASRFDNDYGERFICFSELSLELSSWESVPDLSIYAKSDIDMSEDEIEVSVPPLCVVEILSPSQSLQELLAKAKRYFSYDVKSCWLVIPGLKNIYVFSSPDDYQIFRDNQTLHDAVIDVKLELAKVFS